METTTIPVQQNATKVATKWALIYTVVAIINTYVFQYLNIDQTSSWKYLSTLIFILFVILTQKEYRDTIGGYITYGNAFSAGFRFSVFSGVLVGVFTCLYYYILSPQMFDKMLETVQAAMDAKNAPSNVVEGTMNFYRNWGKVMFPFFTAIGCAIVGTIVSLITAAIFKKERSPYDIAQDAIDPTETNV